MAEKEGFEPSIPLWGIHDFQSCALDQATRLLHVLFRLLSFQIVSLHIIKSSTILKETHFLRGFVSAQQTGKQISHALGVAAVLLRHGGQRFPERGRRGVCRRVEPLRQREFLRIDAAKILRCRTQTRAGGGRDAALARVQEIFHLQLLLVRPLLCRNAEQLLAPGADALCKRCVKRGPSRLGADALGEQIGQRVGLRRCGRGRVCAARHTLPDALKCAVVKKNGILHLPYPRSMLWPGLQKRAKCAIITAETFPPEATIMARFFIAGTNFPNGRAIIRGRDADHIRVLRLRAGDDIVICDGAGRDYKCRLVQTLEHEAEAEVIEVVPCKAEPTVRTTVFAGLPKGERSDFLVQKCTEAGAAEIVFFSCTRCVAKAVNMEKKLERWQRIAEEAAKQSGRGIIPQVRYEADFVAVLNGALHTDLPLFMYETGERETIRDAIEHTAQPIASVAIITGPEGGFAEFEADMARKLGMHICSMGERILRCETAPVVALTALMYGTGNL